jgi:hypothetical protein
MIKMLILQQWHGLSDPNLKDRQMTGFHSGIFLDYLIKYPIDPRSGFSVKEYPNSEKIVRFGMNSSAIWMLKVR